MRVRHLIHTGYALVVIALLGVLPAAAVAAIDPGPTGDGPSGAYTTPGLVGATLSREKAYDPALGAMIAQVDESSIYRTAAELQSFPTRIYPSEGNTGAGDYLYRRLLAIPNLEVRFQGDGYRNIIATLPGTDPDADAIVIAGAHYDSISDDPALAPGATDNGGGVAIVLELARVMSAHRFNRTIQFAFWNAEEDSLGGSRSLVAYARQNDLEIPLYVNFDSACYDPDGEYVLDVIYNDDSAPFAALYTRYNDLYGIGLALTYNDHECGSDHTAFWEGGYPAITTHSQEHAPGDHSAGDTVDLISPSFAKKNGQIGMLVLATGANAGFPVTGVPVQMVPGGVGLPTDTDGDGLYDDVNGNGRKDFADIALYNSHLSWIAANEPISAFDYDGDGRIDIADVLWLNDSL